MIQIAALWGTISGVLYILITWFSIHYRIELNEKMPIWPLLNTGLYVLILGFCIFFGMQKIKNKLYAETGINYGQALYTGVIISIITGVLSGFFFLVYIEYFNSTLGYQIATEMKLLMIQNKKTSKEITETVFQIKNQYQPINLMMSSLIGTTTMGIICSSILAMFVRNRDAFTSK
jgi:hypothetical protein